MRISKVMLLEVMTDSKSVCLEDASRPFLHLISVPIKWGWIGSLATRAAIGTRDSMLFVLFTCQTSQFYQQPYTI
jgi:hypothetical protein